MPEENDIVTGSKGETAPPQARQVSIRMQQGEHTGQPIYSNFSSVHLGQGVVIIDFGFLDPQTMNAFNRMIRSTEKTSGTIDAKMSCRMAVSIDAANHLARQLNQLLSRKTDSQAQQHDVPAQAMETTSSIGTPDENDTKESRQGGFRFPWSRKTH